MDQALHDDLASPASSSTADNDDNNNDNDENADDEKAHSFRERRLTYSRHHILSDSAAAAVAQLLADGDNYSDDDDASKGGVEARADSSSSAATGQDKRKLDAENDQEEQQRPNKKMKIDNGTHLPSRILHAGEIVRRFSDETNARTGLHSHPTHPRHHNHDDQQHHHHPKNKWRQRFSFCSTVPDHILPFPRHIVGTYSCHGMEPVYDSDYDSNSSEDDKDDDGSDCIGNKPGKSSIAKINQDRGGIAYPYANSMRQALFAVYDGHGEGGELVSQFALGEVQRLLEGRLRKLPTPVSGGLSGVAEEEESDGEDGDDREETAISEENVDRDIAQAMREVFVKVDRGLLNEAEIEPMYAGTTACAVLLRNNKLYISNCGDSRAVLASRCSDNDNNHSNNTNNDNDSNDETENNSTTNNILNNLTITPLSIDQNPNSPGEQERILSAGGYVSPPPEPGLSSRVWLDPSHTQIGLAMARSIGDHAVKGVGVIADPVVNIHEVDGERDEFMIIATDGVWEFISSEDAVEIVAKHLYGDDGRSAGSNGASVACEALIKAASEQWHKHEGDYRDDITAMVIRLKDLWK